MKLIRPKQLNLTIEPVADYTSTLLAMSCAVLRGEMTRIYPVETTPLLEKAIYALSSGGATIEIAGRTLKVKPFESSPFTYPKPVADYELFRNLLVLASTREGSKIGLVDDIDTTLQMLILALRRLGAELEFVGGDDAHVLVKRAIDRPIRYHLKRDSAKNVPQLILAMSALEGRSEIHDLFESSRYDYIFQQFLGGFSRESTAEPEPEDELQRRLFKRRADDREYLTIVRINNEQAQGELEVQLRPDVDMAAYLAAALLAHGKGKLTLKSLSSEDVNGTPLGQLKRMGAQIEATTIEGEPVLIVGDATTKGRTIKQEQLHDHPDAVGALALAGTHSEGTSVIRTSPFHTEREESQRRHICELIRSYGIKIAEIDDGFVVEGQREFAESSIVTNDDPVCALAAVAAGLSLAPTVEIDTLEPLSERWGKSLQDAIAPLLPQQ